MRKFTDLTNTEKRTAFNKALNEELQCACECPELYTEELQEKIEKAWKQAEAMRTPWFFHEYIMDTCRQELKAIALFNAKNALYPEPGEYVIHI